MFIRCREVVEQSNHKTYLSSGLIFCVKNVRCGTAGAFPFAAGVVVTAGAVDADVPAPSGIARVAVGTAGAAAAAGGFVPAVRQTHCRQRFMQPSDSGIFSDKMYSVWHACNGGSVAASSCASVGAGSA
eukprot:scaffold362611_cov31-Attheya_sp.AAC.1